jgi:hypothetical protein
VTEHHKPIQSLFLVQLVKTEEGTQGFAGPRAGMYEDIASQDIASQDLRSQRIEGLLA